MATAPVLLLSLLAPPLQGLGDLGVLLVQALAPLLGEGVLVPVRRVVPRQHVDGGVQGAEGGLAGDLGEPAVVGDKVDHLLLHVLAKVLHPVGPLPQGGRQEHVVPHLGGVLVVLEGQAPVLGELVRHDLVGDVRGGRNGGGGAGGEEDGRRGGGRSLEEPTAGRGGLGKVLTTSGCGCEGVGVVDGRAAGGGSRYCARSIIQSDNQETVGDKILVPRGIFWFEFRMERVSKR